MIRFIDTAFVQGMQFRAGMVGQFDIVTELQIVAAGDGVRLPIPEQVAQKYVGAVLNSVNGAGDTAFTQMAAITVPGGLMGLNSVLNITLDWGYTGSTSTKILTLKWGGAPISQPSTTGAGVTGMKSIIEIANANSMSLQKIQNNNNYGAATRGTDRTSDTSLDVQILLGGQWSLAASGESITLIGYRIWHYPGS